VSEVSPEDPGFARGDGPLSCQREAFSIPDGLHYLNCAYMGPLPKAAEVAGIEGLRSKSHPWKMTVEDFFDPSDQVRALFGGLVGGEPEDVAIHPSVSYAVATAAKNLEVPAGSRIVLLGEQFPGNVYSWTRRAREADAAVHTVARPSSATPGADWNAELLAAITPETSVVTVPIVHWTDGTRFDLASVSRRVREVGAALVVDGTQSIGAVPFSVKEIQPDLLVSAGYKWLLGPYGLALTWLGPRFADGVPLEEGWIARKGSEDFQGLIDYTEEYGPGRVRYDVGERSNFALMPALRASLAGVAGWGPDRISSYIADLTGPLLAEARALGFLVEEDRWRSPHLFGLRMPPGLELGELRDALGQANVHVSLRGTALRVSPNVYNDARDVDALVAVLRAAVS